MTKQSEKRAIVGSLVVLLVVFGAIAFTASGPALVGVMLTWPTVSLWVIVAARFGLVANAGFALLTFGGWGLALPFGISAAVIIQVGLGLLPYVFGFWTATASRSR